MADKRQTLFQGTLGVTPGTTLYTNVSGEEALVQQIRVHNGSASPVTGVFVSIGADAAGTRVFGGITLQAFETKVFDNAGVPITGTTQIQGAATGTAGVVACLVTGTRRLV